MFLADIQQARSCYPGLAIWAGVEAKVLPGGELDLSLRWRHWFRLSVLPVTPFRETGDYIKIAAESLLFI